MKYIIYLRKSTESKERQVMSLPAQKRILSEIAKKEKPEMNSDFKCP